MSSLGSWLIKQCEIHLMDYNADSLEEREVSLYTPTK